MPLTKEKLVEESNILSELEKVRKVIQQKHKLLKNNQDTLEQSSINYFKPLLTPLKQISENVASDTNLRKQNLSKNLDYEAENEEKKSVENNDNVDDTLINTEEADMTIIDDDNFVQLPKYN